MPVHSGYPFFNFGAGAAVPAKEGLFRCDHTVVIFRIFEKIIVRAAFFQIATAKLIVFPLLKNENGHAITPKRTPRKKFGIRQSNHPANLWKIETERRPIAYYFCKNSESMKIQQTSLQKLERVLTEAGYLVRYERGNFQSGYCILEQKKVVVLNKFLQLEGRIQTLMELIPLIKINIDLLTNESQKLYLSLSAALQSNEA
jgi:hypothetical protein